MFTVILGASFCWLLADSTPARAWNDSYAQAVAEVKRTDRPLFVVLDRGSSPVGRMVRDGTFLSTEVEEALAADYVRLFVDTETEFGRKLAAQFGAIELPRVVIIDRTGEWQVYRRSGTHTSSEVLSQLARHRRSKIVISSDTSVSESRTTSTVSNSSWSPALCKT
jgi:hypothetical protein